MSDPGQYSGITDAVDSVQAKSGYSGPDDILSSVPSEETVVQWTDSLTGFEAETSVSSATEDDLTDIRVLYADSETALQKHAAELGVKSLNEFGPDAVLFMVCIRDLQTRYAGKSNLNPHKLSVLLGGRYSVS